MALTILKNFINGVSGYFNPNPIQAVNVAPAPNLASTATIANVLNPPLANTNALNPPLANANPLNPLLVNANPWYWVDNAYEATILADNAKRDGLWSVINSLNLNFRLKPTNNFWQQTIGQQLWTSTVIALAPFTAFGWHKFYGESYKNCLIYTGIASCSSLSAIIPWNILAFYGEAFYTSIGCNKTTAEYLAVIFPGPGAIEGPLQTLVTTLLSYLFIPNYNFNGVRFGLGLSPWPISAIAGNSWLLAFNALAKVAKESTGGLIAQAFVVMLTVLIMNYLTMKASAALDKQCRKFCGHCCGCFGSDGNNAQPNLVGNLGVTDNTVTAINPNHIDDNSNILTMDMGEEQGNEHIELQNFANRNLENNNNSNSNNYSNNNDNNNDNNNLFNNTPSGYPTNLNILQQTGSPIHSANNNINNNTANNNLNNNNNSNGETTIAEQMEFADRVNTNFAIP